MAKVKSWFSAHKSAIFIALIFLTGVIFFFIGYILQELKPPGTFCWSVGNILAQISGMLIAAAIGTVFLSFKDVKKYISKRTAQLITTGKIINLTTDEALDKLERSIITRRLDSPQLNKDLNITLNLIRKKCLVDFYLENYRSDITFILAKKHPEKIINQHTLRYRVYKTYNSNCNGQFPFKYLAEIPVINDSSISNKDHVLKCKYKIGEQFGDKEPELSEYIAGNIKIITVKLEDSVKMHNDYLDIWLETELLYDKQASYDMPTVRYPTKGFDVRLTFQSSLKCKYQCEWFRFWDNEKNSFPGVNEQHPLPNGIRASTNDWMLPGEGVLLKFYPGDC